MLQNRSGALSSFSCAPSPHSHPSLPSSLTTCRARCFLLSTLCQRVSSTPCRSKVMCSLSACLPVCLSVSPSLPFLILLPTGLVPLQSQCADILPCLSTSVRNAAQWRDVVSPLALQTLTMDTCTSKMLLPFLQTLRVINPADAADLAKLLLESFPDEWHERPAFQPFLAFCTTLR